MYFLADDSDATISKKETKQQWKLNKKIYTNEYKKINSGELLDKNENDMKNYWMKFRMQIKRIFLREVDDDIYDNV